MDSKITMVLEILSDGRWHEVDELRRLIKLDELKMREITAFMNRYGFARNDDKNKKVKISRDFQRFLAQTII
jgi:DNA-binding IclR family transcriptional regulator